MMQESLSGSKSKRDRATMQERRGSDKGKFHSAVRVAAAAWVLCLLLAACGMSTEEQWQEQYDLGQQYLLDGDYEQAIVAFTAAIEIDPDVVDAYLGRAEAYIGGDIGSASTENLNLALADYDVAIELDGTLTEAFVSRGDVYVVLGTEEDLEEAISDYSSAISLDDTKAEYYIRRGDVYVALGSTEDLEEAISDYTSAIIMDNTNAEVYVSRGNTYAAKGTGSEDDLRAAIADYDSAIALDNTLTELYLTEAALYFEIGDYAGAVEAYTNAIEVGLGDSEIYLSRAEAYYELAMAETDAAASGEEADSLSDSAIEHFNDALADYLTVLELGGDSEDIYLRISEIYILLEDYDSAEAILEQGLLFHPLSTVLAQQLEEIEFQDYVRDYIREVLADRVSLVVAQWEEALKAFMDGETSYLYFTDEYPLPDDFDEFVGNIAEVDMYSGESGVAVELDDGNWIVVYKSGRIYYGEMENGERSGHGAIFSICEWGHYEVNKTVPRYGLEGYLGEWSSDEANGQGYRVEGTSYIFDITFVDGYADGVGTVYGKNSASLTYPAEVEADNGVIVKVNGEETEDGKYYGSYFGSRVISVN